MDLNGKIKIAMTCGGPLHPSKNLVPAGRDELLLELAHHEVGVAGAQAGHGLASGVPHKVAPKVLSLADGEAVVVSVPLAH